MQDISAIIPNFFENLEEEEEREMDEEDELGSDLPLPPLDDLDAVSDLPILDPRKTDFIAKEARGESWHNSTTSNKHSYLIVTRNQ